MAKKPEILYEPRHIRYDDIHWKNLEVIREKAQKILKLLVHSGIQAYTYGSVARGDVHHFSDIDIIIPYSVPSFKIELVCRGWTHRELVQATPTSVLKGHLHFQDNVVITFPLFKMKPREYEFYKWGGLISLKELDVGKRVAGVDKRLLLIVPTHDGHIEFGVIGHEHEVARKLGVSINIAQERVRVLKRRDTVGRTGVYLSQPVPDNQTFEECAKKLQDRNPALRRTIHRRS